MILNRTFIAMLFVPFSSAPIQAENGTIVEDKDAGVMAWQPGLEPH